MGSLYRTLGRATFRDIAFACLAVWLVAVSYGALAVASGFPWWFPVLQGFLVLAGASELLFVGLVGAGGNPLAAALAGLGVNARHVAYGLGLPDVLGSGWRRLLGAHLMNDESVAFSIAQSSPERRRAAYWVCGIGVLITWPSGAACGVLFGSLIRDTAAFGLDAMFPAVLIALVMPALRDRVTLRAALAGGAIALAAAPFLPAGIPVLLALAGVVVIAIRPSSGAAGATVPEPAGPPERVIDAGNPVGEPGRAVSR
jgi:4-azaleucine resistance transporter AzlC